MSEEKWRQIEATKAERGGNLFRESPPVCSREGWGVEGEAGVG